MKTFLYNSNDYIINNDKNIDISQAKNKIINVV
jgi:hypothetical protein